MNMQFGAPWGRELKVLTIIGVLVMGVPIAIQMAKGFWVVSSLLPALLLVIASLCVRGYELAPGELRVKRLLWSTIWPLDPGVRARASPHAMQGSWRTWGNGGLFAISGHFSGSGLGRYRAFVTDPARTVVIETRKGIVVVSPDRPDEFVAAVTAAARSASAPR
jgi:hypothetical protein